MTATTVTRPAPATGNFGSMVRDGLIVMWRNLKRIPRIPELAIFAILQSIMFVVLFAYIFGGAIPIPGGGNYNEFLIPGIFAQTIVFACGTTAVGITDDSQKGIIDRFRSLPMARSAFLAGRSLADVIYNAGILVVLILSGLFVGWTVRTGLGGFVSGVALLLLFAFAMSWLGIFLGLSVPTVEVANQVIFTVLFPITFVSNVFVPPETLPDWLQPIAEWNPTSTLTASLRELWGNPNPYASGSFPSENPILVTLVWVVVIVAVFAPLGVRKYRNLSR
jgi:ABC-2 type transport system permease protein